MRFKSFQERLDRWMGPAFQRPPDPSVVPPDVSRREAQARRTLRWYAPSWREAHGEELVTTVLDAAPPGGVGDGEPGLAISTRAELAKSGLGQRLRARPPWRVRWRLVRGREPLTWERLAWLRDTLDQRGRALRVLAGEMAFVLVWGLLWFSTVFNSFETAAANAVSIAVVVLALPVVVLIRRDQDRKQRWRAIRRAGLTPSGWPIAWNPPPPPQVLAPLPPPRTRWVVGELRLALGACLVGGLVATVTAYAFLAGQTDPATSFGYVLAPHVSDLAPIAFLVAAVCGIVGAFAARSVNRRARRLLRPDARPRSLDALPVDSPGAIAHSIPSVTIFFALAGVVCPLAPAYGWILGGVELLAVPVLIALLRTTRTVETETGVAVHQRQIAAAIGGRFWKDTYVPGHAPASPGDGMGGVGGVASDPSDP